MNLRTLKKLSKRAAPILIAHYGLEVFIAERGDNYHGLEIRCHHKPKKCRRSCDCKWHPLKGTPMVGEMSGYYEPEWSEETAWERLGQLVHWEGRAKTMTDDEWASAMKIARREPVDGDELEAWCRDSLAEAENDADPSDCDDEFHMGADFSGRVSCPK